MASARYIDDDEALIQDLKDPEFRRAYYLQKPRYDLVRDLISLRVMRGLSQSELARKAGTHQSRVSRIESAEQEVTLGTIAKLADALDADVDLRLVPRQDREFYAELLRDCARQVTTPWQVGMTLAWSQEEAFA